MEQPRNNKDIATFLKQASLDKYFSSPYIKDSLRILRFRKGDYICHEGDPVDFLYILVEGRTKIITTQENGKTLLLCFYQGVRFIGDVEFFTDMEYSTTIQAVTDASCLCLRRSVVEKIISEDISFLRKLTENLAENLLRSTKNGSLNLLYPLEQRLASYILMSHDKLQFHENLSNLADLLATSYRHLLRVISHFCDMGILEHREKGYRITDLHRLKEAADDIDSVSNT